MKFGGTSVESIQKIYNVSNIVSRQYKKNKIIVVLSAMAGVTDQLQSYIDEINYPPSKETDLIMTSGEQVTVGLLSMILNKKGIKSVPLLGWQVPIITDDNYEKGLILNINQDIINNYFEEYDVVVLAGFQGINLSGHITSLGRGGSDTTAVAIASALKAERCDIYTDVEGVYTTDPNIDPKAKKINKLAYEEMLEMSSTGVSYSKNESKISISGIPDKPGISAIIFGLMANNNINVDMIVQNISQDGITANMTFTVPIRDLGFAMKILENQKNNLKYNNLSSDSDIAKISVIGMGMMSQSGVAGKMFETLAKNKINILAISTSEIKISVLINKKYTELALKSLHSVYRLGNK